MNYWITLQFNTPDGREMGANVPVRKWFEYHPVVLFHEKYPKLVGLYYDTIDESGQVFPSDFSKLVLSRFKKFSKE